MAVEPETSDGITVVPDWGRQIWLASFNSVVNPLFGTKLEVGETIAWSIEPFSVSEFADLYTPGDIVAIEARDPAATEGYIIAVGVLTALELSGLQKPSISFQILAVASNDSFGFLHNDPIKDRAGFITGIVRLSKIDSERFSTTLQRKFLPASSGDVRQTASSSQPERASFKQAKKPDQPPKPTPPPTPQPEPDPTPTEITTKSRFNSDQPHTVRDSLRRAPNAFVIAQYLNRLRGEPKPHNHHKHQHNDSYVLHVDAPWGGGKTTFANFIANFLSYARHKTPQDQLDFIDNSGVTRDRLNSMADNNWMILHFNAWENQHVNPPWWNFYTSFLNGYKDNIAHPEGLQINEYWWRFFTPETKKSLAVTGLLICIGVILAMSAQGTDPETGAATFTNAATLTTAATLLGATSLLAFVFTQAKAGIRRIVDASKSAYNPTVLGEEDPLSRLGGRFLEVAGYHNRPVLMVIDDIDRCEPDYVVELMRGLITIFQSNHVSYLLLGDRGWIEQSFENVNEQMADAHSDPTVSFGARFTEKVVQISYLLPVIPDEERQSYLRSLLSDKDSIESQQQAEQKAIIREQTKEKYENLATSKAVADTKSRTKESVSHDDPDLKDFHEAENRTQAAMARASMGDQEKVIRHGLEDLWKLLPENPRRVKRLVNMIAVYQASGETTLGIDPDAPNDWLPMVFWLMLFSEYPNVHEHIYYNPDLLDPLTGHPDTSSDPDAPIPLRYDWEVEEPMPLKARKIINGITLDGKQISVTKEIAKRMKMLTPLD